MLPRALHRRQLALLRIRLLLEHVLSVFDFLNGDRGRRIGEQRFLKFSQRLVELARGAQLDPVFHVLLPAFETRPPHREHVSWLIRLFIERLQVHFQRAIPVALGFRRLALQQKLVPFALGIERGHQQEHRENRC